MTQNVADFFAAYQAVGSSVQPRSASPSTRSDVYLNEVPEAWELIEYYPNQWDNVGIGSALPGTHATRNDPMDDKDVLRLEDRIEALRRESDLRLDGVMTRIEAKIDQKFLSIENQIKISNRNFEILDKYSKDAVDASKSLRNSQIGWSITIIIAIIGSFIGISQVYIGMKQIWGTGVEVGQQIQSTQKLPIPRSNPNLNSK